VKLVFIILQLMLFVLVEPVLSQKALQHYIFFNRERHLIRDSSFLECDAITGAQLKYAWRELEPAEGKYDFSEIEKDLTFLAKEGKKLFIQIQDVSFDTSIINVPLYLLHNPVYSGGAAHQYVTDERDSITAVVGYVARRWDREVASRFYRLINALGQQFDGRIAGINFPETIIEFGESGVHFPEGFTPEVYRDAILTQMETAKNAFPASIVIQYANFMPGEWLPGDDKGLLSSVFEFARLHDIGMGGPDIKVYNIHHMNHVYKFLMTMPEAVVTGAAVQWGNYEIIHPKTGSLVTIDQILDFAQNELKLDIIFWSPQEPYFTRAVMPTLGCPQ
jgi:hypothetical protein